MSHPPGLEKNDRYVVLGLSPDATDDEIRSAYKKLALKWHPDRHTVDKEHAAQMFIEVNAAYRALMDGKETIHSKLAEDTAKSASGSDGHSTHSSSKHETHSKSSAGKEHETSSDTSASPKPDSEFGTKNTHSSTAKSNSKSSYSGSSSRSSKTPNTRSRPKHDHPSSMPSHATPSESHSTNSSREHIHSSYKMDDHQARSTSSRRHHGSAHTSASPPSGTHSEKDKDTHPPSSHTHFSATSTATPAESGTSVRSKTSRSRGIRTNVSNSSKPVIPPISQLHKSSRFGFGDDFVQKLSKGKPKTPKRRKAEDGSDSEDEGAPVYGSPLRPLTSPRGSSKEWIFPLPLTLDDMYHGTNFRFRIIREMLSRQKKEVEIEIDIPPGCRSGTRIVCPGTGHERKDGTLQDVVFLVEEVSHDRFSRVKDDLFLDICVPWVDSLADQGGELCVEGINGEEIMFSLPYPLQDQATEGKIIIKRAGMPVFHTGKTKGRGDLIIRWQVVFSNPSKWQSLKKVFHLKA
ncbi:hypothetical protein SERLA73DRAFT_73414 [Serpula lacrymans var. lacrymans S7.3]|uniref:J domain-containing protein n=1 Tax=Serpula lacrymans var. lacrymans (strain S7.3) TaxID=936435 RepID=F8PY62_SERL3|nr:hypothetical protein SERLA73DRAFT_73414 [Serpula lacrymans var. lacrymans S7.3]